MAQLDGYTCDACGQKGGHHVFYSSRLELPNHWFTVHTDLMKHSWTELQFCSKECVEQWLTGKTPVAVPERPRVLFKRWVKAVFGWEK